MGINKIYYIPELSDELYHQLIRNNINAREITKEIRELSNRLKMGYDELAVTENVKRKIDFLNTT